MVKNENKTSRKPPGGGLKKTIKHRTDEAVLSEVVLIALDRMSKGFSLAEIQRDVIAQLPDARKEDNIYRRIESQVDNLVASGKVEKLGKGGALKIRRKPKNINKAVKKTTKENPSGSGNDKGANQGMSTRARQC